jgi:ferrous iron transport protein B
MATLYAVEDGNNQALLTERLQNATNKNTGKKVFTLATAMSLMIFYLYAMQCVSTMAVVKRETKSWKWPIFQFIYMGVLAYIGSWIVFQIFS